MGKVRSHRDLLIYEKAFKVAMEIFSLSKSFPKEETYSLTDQIRRSSRSIPANLAEAYRKRIYPKLFVSKMIDCESEAAETQVWLDFAFECGYLPKIDADRLNQECENIISMAVNMRLHPEQWQP